MSEEKLYVVKNDEGKYWDFEGRDDFWALVISDCPTTPSKEQAELVADEHGGHVVTLIEEPEKVVLSKEQAKIVKDAHDNKIPACHIANKSDDEELLMNAYVNGYTMAKEKKYNVKVPHANYKWYLKTPDGKLDTIFVEGLSKGFGGYPDGIELTNDDIEKFGLQDCEKEEVTDDGDEV
ncbi:DUF1642 domain-containing protein [Lacticaseibacillus paracasei]|uniref:DUF1642 domain-containing protein n=1 Tax=Lacticaseibacillus paracasei TaxID=1597 RepID=UPI00019C990E|nr:DUF1642 domain-containing protein [Lacticaseibacillus paracasei]EEI67804.1 hypothetical protein HMPREF0530_1922 [Lacticaseibacillus paracasei subsp. paracasei ATCC 25302 = DSM 5622 = JCM 8130]KRM63831.1 hypothetical protein FC74_GL002277 [Lacticaseibacillus paracasei subsp. paracasei ATCC 25302 = DSM 5622 = JCM 8130]MBA4475134.1 DUF1642 domain-containing protein [Lacticaseibacillus paracasei]TDG88577.1 hypothetical protein C5L26_002965 [Lacticaseibacillus paracasei subsp. paracasei]BAN72070